MRARISAKTARTSWVLSIVPALLAIVFWSPAASMPAARAADAPAATGDAAESTAPDAGSAADLARQQGELSEKYKRFEEVLLRMAELTAPSDPKRAALLRKAVAESKHQLIGLQLDKLVELLTQDRLSVALSGQNDVNKDLAELLELLMSEERDKGLKDERARVKEQIRRVTELINKERQLQGQTSGNGDLQDLARGQGKVAEDTAKLAEDMKPQEGNKPADSEGDAGSENQKQQKKNDQNGTDKPSDKQSDKQDDSQSSKPEGEGQSSPGKGDDQKPAKQGNPDDKKSDRDKSNEDKSGKKPDDKQADDKSANDEKKKGADEQKPSEAQGKSGKPNDQKQQGEQQQGQNQGEQSDEDQQDQSPQQKSADSARKRVQAAQEKMDTARQKLEKAQREGAAEEQEAAIRELEQAKAELEEILRQLREEELERMLAMLEARFRKMLQAQIEVYEGTKRVDRTPSAERDRDDEIEAGRLSRRESQIVLEAESALTVLREEGSAVAFPEAVEQMREDMDQIVARLGQSDVGDITQGIEEDVIAALEEMIEALQKAQQDMEKQKQQQQQPPAEGEQPDPPLIDQLAELKMIRSLQMRINMRTKRLARLVEGDVGQADKPELLDQLQRLAEREESVFRVTRDIVTGKNR
ncbi:MAG TPA: hypothetical protein VGG64_26855 [Pirellulales bacterium]|jgi:hypothetical protein